MTIRFRTKTSKGWTVNSVLTPFTFPDGAAHIKGAERLSKDDIYHVADVRGHDPQDLVQLMMWSDAIEQCSPNAKRIVLLPYLPGARMDRGTPQGAAAYANLINQVRADQVITLDPHSPIMPHYINHLTIFPFERIIRREIGVSGDTKAYPYDAVIAPDKGAVDRATRAANVLHVPVLRAEKTRDFATGKLSGFEMINDVMEGPGHYLIVDDICDGGGTFVGLADEIHKTHPDAVIDLWVTHGIFSKGWEAVIGGEDPFKGIGHIHTTNSFHVPSGIESKFVTTHDILPYLTGEING